jgi:AraC-like DNA-binding protein
MERQLALDRSSSPNNYLTIRTKRAIFCNEFGTRLVNITQGEDVLATIRQVAQQAGVSIVRVSRVFNSKSGVSERTCQHVLNVAQELGYVSPKRLPPFTSQVTHLGLLIRPTGEPLAADPF